MGRLSPRENMTGQLKDVIHAYHGCRDRILIYGGALLGLMGVKHYDLHPAGWMTGCTAKSFEREGRT